MLSWSELTPEDMTGETAPLFDVPAEAGRLDVPGTLFEDFGDEDQAAGPKPPRFRPPAELCRPPVTATRPELYYFETLPRDDQIWMLGYLGAGARWERCLRDLSARRAERAALAASRRG
jgi:hypothetical protein